MECRHNYILKWVYWWFLYVSQVFETNTGVRVIYDFWFQGLYRWTRCFWLSSGLQSVNITETWLSLISLNNMSSRVGMSCALILHGGFPDGVWRTVSNEKIASSLRATGQRQVNRALPSMYPIRSRAPLASLLQPITSKLFLWTYSAIYSIGDEIFKEPVLSFLCSFRL